MKTVLSFCALLICTFSLIKTPLEAKSPGHKGRPHKHHHRHSSMGVGIYSAPVFAPVMIAPRYYVHEPACFVVEPVAYYPLVARPVRVYQVAPPRPSVGFSFTWCLD